MIANQPIRDDISTQIAINRGVIRARWILIIGLVLVGILLKISGQGQSTLVPSFFQIFLLLVISSSYNLAYLLFLKLKKRQTERSLAALGFFQITVDILVFTMVIYLAGGIDSNAFLYYVYPIIAASQFFRTRGILFAIALTTSLYVTVIGLEYFELIPHFSAYIPEYAPNHFQNPPYTFVVVVNVIFSLALAGAFASVTSRIKDKHADIVKIERDRISAILESLEDGIILIDTDNRLILANESAEHILNIPREHMLNVTLSKRNIKRIANHENLLTLFFPSQEYRSPSLKKKYTIIFRKPIQMELEVMTIPVVNTNGTIIGYLKDLHDITREREIDRMKSEFISIAAHQLRTPLSAMKWSLKMVMDGDVGAVPKEMGTLMSKTYSTNERMIRLVNDLLNVSRIEEGRFKYIYKKMDIGVFIDSVVQEVRKAATDSDTKITWRKPRKLPHVFADHDRLRLAIMNLLDNALAYTFKDGHITIAAEEVHDDYVKVSITDNGIGIPVNERHRLFTKFYRGSNVLKRQTEGSGLGLFIVKSIIEKHRGIVECVSTEGKGTTFYIYLPTKQLSDSEGTETERKPFEKFLTDF